jgi:N-acetylglutamate synthase-like GNAT family acetyltransferase
VRQNTTSVNLVKHLDAEPSQTAPLLRTRNVHIREATRDDLPVLTDLGVRSKASWPYSEALMQVFREELTWSDELLTSRRVYVLEQPGNKIVGYYSLNTIDTETIDLEHLFVDPDHFGHRIGAQLYRHAVGNAGNDGALKMTIMSDPNAAGFYDRMGCRKVADIPSSIPGRTIPTYEVELQEPQQ